MQESNLTINSNDFEVKVENVYKKFGNFTVLNDISFNIQSGQSVAILGQSGTGKSVLLRIIGTLLDADSGSIKLNSQEVVGMPQGKKQKIIKKIGFLFQNSGLFEDITLWENVCLKNLYLDKKPDIEKLKKESFELLDMLGIRKDAFYLSPAEISGGMQKRVALARVLKQCPNLILLDELNSGLDPITSDAINTIYQKIQSERKITSISITHDLRTALCADKILLLRNGKIEWSGEPKEFTRTREHEYINNFIENSTIPKNFLDHLDI